MTFTMIVSDKRKMRFETLKRLRAMVLSRDVICKRLGAEFDSGSPSSLFKNIDRIEVFDIYAELQRLADIIPPYDPRVPNSEDLLTLTLNLESPLQCTLTIAYGIQYFEIRKLELASMENPARRITTDFKVDGDTEIHDFDSADGVIERYIALGKD